MRPLVKQRLLYIVWCLAGDLWPQATGRLIWDEHSGLAVCCKRMLSVREVAERPYLQEARPFALVSIRNFTQSKDPHKVFR